MNGETFFCPGGGNHTSGTRKKIAIILKIFLATPKIYWYIEFQIEVVLLRISSFVLSLLCFFVLD